MELIHRHEYGPCCEHADHLNSRLDFIEMLVTPPVVEEEAVVTESAEGTTDTDTDTDGGSDGEADVNIDIDIDVSADAEESESGEESESHEESGEEDEEEPVVDEEIVVEGETGLPELTEDEKQSGRSHPLPMRR